MHRRRYGASPPLLRHRFENSRSRNDEFTGGGVERRNSENPGCIRGRGLSRRRFDNGIWSCSALSNRRSARGLVVADDTFGMRREIWKLEDEAEVADLIEGRTGQWEVVIGLEVHAQVTAKSKLFSGAATAFGAEPNSQVSTVDAAFPGMLPVINGLCVEQAVRTGLGLDAAVNLHSVFARKNYFYPDLPAGYQISQYEEPIVGHGRVALDMPDGSIREIGITRLHLEQDAGKSLHDQHPRLTYVDLNRSGVALMEIVSEPDMRSAEEAAAYIRKLRAILRYLGTCDGNMEEGSLRCDVNVSVRRAGEPLGMRCEIKNVNSIRFISQAIEYEARRQIALIED